MRLNSIKLSGFKSFVDPTQMVFQSNLTAIVGPNGCGKSNIIDAIYCVFGSSSKNLRADLMVDVIFNGTTTRKPVAQASVELIFDNNDSRLSGEYAKYPEISIRRELNRDGQSNYYLNGTRCRRKDITDIFLGTGLGSNSYAIIEQGMISRLIEAKPEELRAHVEEAAGTSKYKERRRETENRIKHTRENLDRLNDLRDELAKQLTHLQRQANAAEKYKILKAEKRLLSSQLQALHWKNLNEQISIYDQKIRTQETIVESKIADHRHVDKELEVHHLLRTEQNDNLASIQSEYYRLGSEITRIEQSISHARERKNQLETDYAQVEQSYKELLDQQSIDQTQLQLVEKEVEETNNHYETLKDKATTSLNELKLAEEKRNIWQESWDNFNLSASQTAKQSEVEKTKIQHLQQRQQSLITRLGKIRDDQNKDNSEQLTDEVNTLKSQQEQAAQHVAQLQEQLDLINQNLQTERLQYTSGQQDLTRLTKELRDLQARHASMEALQQIAFRKDNNEMKSWLTDNNLQNHTRLAQIIDVETGWERAFEIVLATYLDAICVDEFSTLADSIDKLEHVDITFLNKATTSKINAQRNDLINLSSKVKSEFNIDNLLQDVYIADDLTQALANVALLKENESIVTQDGIWLNAAWMRITRASTEKTGILQREHDLKEIHSKITEKQHEVTSVEQLIQGTQDRMHHMSEEREQLQSQLQNKKAKNSDFLAQISAKENYIAQLIKKNLSLSEEVAETEQQLLTAENELELCHTLIKDISVKINDDQQQRNTLIAQRDELRTNFEEANRESQSSKQRADETRVRIESMRNQLHYLNQNLERIGKQIASTIERKNTLQTSLNNIEDPLPELNTELQQTLENRAVIDTQLQTARSKLNDVDNTLKTLEKNRHSIASEAQEQRDLLEKIRLDCQSLRVKISTYEEQIINAGFTVEQLTTELLDDANIELWEQNIEKVDTRIGRLGPINLAAIEEYKTLSERKEYLDKQHDDLVEALTTLENAIRKIDRETKIRFKETYLQLNNSFKEYFIQIFGGGDAYLELTGDDLLETGVLVKAQPPGKRNSTIHLLSGGEKALTAIALVFAIFSLNPAPFCVLDEVDAPLDDANVVRFCNLVRKMSEKVQFIFISHNKITIEMGKQLAGVTMHEPGVSRLVSVDVDEAISLAEA